MLCIGPAHHGALQDMYRYTIMSSTDESTLTINYHILVPRLFLTEEETFA